jgi:hypothetical protein
MAGAVSDSERIHSIIVFLLLLVNLLGWLAIGLRPGALAPS